MANNTALGVIFSSTNEERIKELTKNRAMGSVPIGGRYRLIDFALSSMVNSGIKKVGVVTKYNYQSLMDHLGNGKPWNLAKKTAGLFLLPPFFSGNTNGFTSRISTLEAISGFIKDSNEEYVLLSDCDMIYNINFKKVIEFSIEKNSDITLVCVSNVPPKEVDELSIVNVDKNKRVIDLSTKVKKETPYTYSYNLTLIKRKLLLELVQKCINENKTSFRMDLIGANLQNYKVYAYEFSGYSHIISSMSEFFKTNMELMLPEVMDELFNQKSRPIYTKVRDDMPARYDFDSDVKSSFIANGCVIQGEVENCVLFRGVHVSKGAKLKNCVIMQDTKIGKDVNLSHVIADKDVIVNDEVAMHGMEDCPVYISKASIV